MKISCAAPRCLLLILVAVAACGQSEPLTATRLGEPLAGLSPNELDRFTAGQVLFNKVFTSDDGLGPLFNDNQCSACHTSPATGGTGDQFVMRASRFIPPDRCDLLGDAGGENVRINATPQLRAHGIVAQPFPTNATERVSFNVPHIFGMGLIEAIPEAEIMEGADPDDRDRDGVSGRAGVDAKGRFARFGRKADQATLRGFVEHAAFQEMGLTSPAFPYESTIGDVTVPEGVDLNVDPELSEEAIALLTDFVRFLGPAHRQRGVSDVDRQTIAHGETLFDAVGCTACHTPSMTTGRHPVAALDRKRIDLYSDLLLHDMGPGLATVCAAGASPTEQRTEPLMGLRHRSVYLHDSRTNDLFEAITTHGGEATLARERFRALSELDRHALVRFLRSL